MKKICVIILIEAVIGALILGSIVVYFTFFYNPLISVTFPILIRIHQEFTINTTNIFVAIKQLQNETFIHSENLPLTVRMITYSRFFYEAFTTKKYSSDQIIQLFAYKNDSEWGIVQNFVLSRIHLLDMESPSRFNKTEKWVVNAFYLRFDPTQIGQTLVTPAWFRPYWALYTNQISFWFVRTATQEDTKI